MDHDVDSIMPGETEWVTRPNAPPTSTMAWGNDTEGASPGKDSPHVWKVNDSRGTSFTTSTSSLTSSEIIEEEFDVAASWDEFNSSMCGPVTFALVFCAVILVLVAGHVADAEHPVFYVCDVATVLALGAYIVLRLIGRARSVAAAWLAGGLITWLLSLQISLSAPSRRRQLLGLGESNDLEACEEGVAAFWIALVLSTAAVVLDPGPPGYFGFFGQLLGIQHLVIGLLLPRPECDTDRASPGGPGGPLLGLPPLWASTLQLCTLAALLTVMRWRQHRCREMEKAIARYVEGWTLSTMGCWMEHGAEEGSSGQNKVERIVQEIEHEEQQCRLFIESLGLDVLRSHSGGYSWVCHVRHLARFLNCCASELQRRSDGDELEIAAVEAACCEQGNAGANMVSGWLERDLMAATMSDPACMRRAPKTAEKSSSDDHPRKGRRNEPLRTIIAFREENKVGDWEFDALMMEKSCSNVLQLVGFEFLRTFAWLPRQPLDGFLQALEGTYKKENPYHSHVHGADMCNSFYFLAMTTGVWSMLPDATCAAAIVAALGHDVGHFARNNPFTISSRHALAVRYNDRSVLESFHAATLSQLLDEEHGSPRSEGARLFVGLAPDQIQKARHIIITLILGTDTHNHLEDLANFRVRIGADSFDPAHVEGDLMQSLGILFRAADIGHSAKDWPLHEEWSKRIVQEFHEQGDEEKIMGLQVSPLCEREGFELAASQIGFLQFICLPTWCELSRFEELLQKPLRFRHRHKNYTCINSGRKQSKDKSVPSKRKSHPDADPDPARPERVRTEPIPTVTRPRHSHQSKTSVSSHQSRHGSHSGGSPADSTSSYHSVRRLSPQTRQQILMVPLAAVCLRPDRLNSKGHQLQVANGHPEASSESPLSRLLHDTCQAQCEENMRMWKAQVDALKAVAEGKLDGGCSGIHINSTECEAIDAERVTGGGDHKFHATKSADRGHDGGVPRRPKDGTSPRTTTFERSTDSSGESSSKCGSGAWHVYEVKEDGARKKNPRFADN